VRNLLVGLALLSVGAWCQPLEFALPDRNGNLLQLRDYRGRPTLLAFVAYWCDTWKPLLSDLKKLRQSLGRQAPQVIWVAVDGRQQHQVRALMDRAEVPFPVVTDYRGQVAGDCRVTVVPTLLVLGSDGQVKARYQGFPGQAALLRHFQPGPEVDYSETAGYLLEEEQVLWRRLLQQRQSRGLPPLQLHPRLTDVAREYVQRLLEQGRFSHWGPESPADRLHRAGLKAGQSGEILLQGPDAAAALRALLQSPSHKQLLLHSHFRQAGLGAIRDGRDGWLYCLLLADQLQNWSLGPATCGVGVLVGRAAPAGRPEWRLHPPVVPGRPPAGGGRARAASCPGLHPGWRWGRRSRRGG